MKPALSMDGSPLENFYFSRRSVKFGFFTNAQREKIHHIIRSKKNLVEFEWKVPEDDVVVREMPKLDPSRFIFSSLASYPSALNPIGLINRGNTCFMNAVLQPLIHLRPFFALFKKFSSIFTGEFLHKFDLISAFISFFDELSLESVRNTKERHSFHECLAPDAVYDAIKRKGSILKLFGNQEDSHEFLCFLIDGLHEEFVQHSKEFPKCYAVKLQDLPDRNENSKWKTVSQKRAKLPIINRHSLSNSSSLITNIFGGCARSSINVSNIKESITVEPFFCLQLDIETHSSMLNALLALANPESVQYSVDNVEHTATKTLLFETLPPILCINLKTFAFNMISGDTQKIDRFIPFPICFQFPSELIYNDVHAHDDIGPSDAPIYRLVSVVYHHGGQTEGGHYTSDVLVGEKSTTSSNPFDSDCWVRFDDDKVMEIDACKVLAEKPNQNAYILFYQMVTDADEADRMISYSSSSFFSTEHDSIYQCGNMHNSKYFTDTATSTDASKWSVKNHKRR